jgi:hypothetical protein
VRSRQHIQTTPKVGRNIGERIIVTMPIHPLCGERLEVIRWVRLPDGRRYVDVQQPHSERAMRLPLSFTDRVPSPIPPSNGKKTSLFTSFGLERLASAIEATRNDNQNGKKFDMEEKRIFSKNTEQVTGNAEITTTQRLNCPSPSAGPPASCRSSLSTGRTGPSDATQGEKKRGGEL